MNPRAVCVALLVLFGAMEFFMRRGTTAKSLQAHASDRGTTPLILLSYAFCVFALSIPAPRLVWPEWVRWLGVLSCAAGTILRLWSMHTLGQYYTRTLVTTPNQSVVCRGPYRVVRHPGYLSAMLVWVSAAVGSGAVMATIAVLVLLAVGYVIRIRAEERMLVEELGLEYREYQKRSWRLIPLLY